MKLGCRLIGLPRTPYVSMGERRRSSFAWTSARRLVALDNRHWLQLYLIVKCELVLRNRMVNLTSAQLVGDLLLLLMMTWDGEEGSYIEECTWVAITQLCRPVDCTHVDSIHNTIIWASYKPVEL